jgi:beta-glucosidase
MDAIATAVASGRLPRGQLEASAERRRAALAQCRPGQADPYRAACPDLALSRQLITATLECQGQVSVGSDRSGGAPQKSGGGVNLVRVDQALQAPFLTAAAPSLSLPAAAGFQPLLLAADTPPLWSGDAAAPLALERLGPGPVLVQLFVRGNPFRGRADSLEPWGAALKQLHQAGRLAGLAVYGSPYLWESLRQAIPAAVPAAYSPGQMSLAQQAVLEALGLGQTEDSAGFTD